jgi:divalent metal cation (Fe/Co/Zn/Cd) transporter
MQYLKKIASKIICPGIAAIVLMIAVSVLLLCYTFLYEKSDTVISYLAYTFSTYTLTVVICKAVKIVKMAKKAVYANPHTNRFLTDVLYRIRISLYGAFIINLTYALVKLISSIIYRSVWFGAVAIYYIILCLIRASLVFYAREHDLGKDKNYEYRIYRFCGILLLILNLALSVLVIQMVRHGQGYRYPGMLIYMAAMVTFYAIILAVFNLIKYRRYDSPAISAAKAINFTTATVSVLSLQTAMFTEFGSDFQYAKFMNSATGCVVCLLTLGTAFYMIIKASHYLRNFADKEEQNV